MNDSVQIIDLPADDRQLQEEVARLLYDGFKVHAPSAWPDMEAAMAQVSSSLMEGRISRIAIGTLSHNEGKVLGWIGAVPDYNGQAWILNPLVVRPKYQEQGIGSALVADLEAIIKRLEGITLYLGTDDEDNRTSLGGVDLYPNVMEQITNIKNLDRHPYEFYQKNGFVIVGVIPDANGPGKPDIIMAKRVVG